MFNKQSKVTYVYDIKKSLTNNCKVYKIKLVDGEPKKKQMVKKGLSFADAENLKYKLENKIK